MSNQQESEPTSAYDLSVRLAFRIKEALDIAYDFGSVDGAHHKQWVMDQMLRALLADDYCEWVAEYEKPIDEDSDDYYEWDTGIAP